MLFAFKKKETNSDMFLAFAGDGAKWDANMNEVVFDEELLEEKISDMDRDKIVQKIKELAKARASTRMAVG